jgi:nucleotide-binding universal stress UspA family protein
MSGFKTIVVGVDFSEYSKIAVKQAMKLAEIHGVPLVVVHGLNPAQYMSGSYYQDFQKDVIDPMKTGLIDFYGFKNMQPQPEIIAQLGFPAEVIVQVAKCYENPLVVVGHKGQSGLKRLVLGSTAEWLALHCPYPLWIHRGNSIKAPKRILLPCDFSERTRKAFDAASLVAATVASKFKFLNVSKKGETEPGEKQRVFLSWFPDIPLTRVSGEPAKKITDESEKFDVIAMVPHNRDTILSALGSVTAKVVRMGNTPILIAK